LRNKYDYYPTPKSIVRLIGQRIPWEPCYYWEPCDSGGAISNGLQEFNFTAYSSDIQKGQDFFQYQEPPVSILSEKSPTVITNPPFRQIRQFIDHAFSIGIERMVLVCAERLWACKKGREQFNRHKPKIFSMMDWREDYLGKGGSPDRALAVSIWDSPCADTCDFQVWYREE
jgi:hypothetical protein|tara:strand:- start:16 stop:531 length:516 start_codon:yes stop_codon:yes gene_type:complete